MQICPPGAMELAKKSRDILPDTPPAFEDSVVFFMLLVVLVMFAVFVFDSAPLRRERVAVRPLVIHGRLPGHGPVPTLI